jgi:hypothetical protein
MLIIKDNDETNYRNCIKYVSDWCKSNILDLNVTKTKEIIFDFIRTNNGEKQDIVIDDKTVEITDNYPYLGVCIDNKTTTHT